MGKTAIEWADRSWWHERSAASRLGIPPEDYIAHLAIGEKWCTTCKAWHSRGVFLKDVSRGDGLAASCRKRKTQPLSREEKRNRRNARYRAYYAASGGAAIRARVYARKRQLEPIAERTAWLIRETFGGCCAYCGELAGTMDHVVPVKRGGESRRGNLVPACVRCNSRKRTKKLDAFLTDCTRRGLRPRIDLIVDELVMGVV